MKTISLSLCNINTSQLIACHNVIAGIEQICQEVSAKLRLYNNANVKFTWHIDISDGIFTDRIVCCPQLLDLLSHIMLMPIDMHFMTESIKPYHNVIGNLPNIMAPYRLIFHKTDDFYAMSSEVTAPTIIAVTNAEHSRTELLALSSSVLVTDCNFYGTMSPDYAKTIEHAITNIKRAGTNSEIIVESDITSSNVELVKQADTIVLKSAMGHYAFGNLEQYLLEISKLILD